MVYVQDFKWTENMQVKDLLEHLGSVGFQSVELKRAMDVFVKMKKANAKIYLTFTSNMVTSGLRGFFAQLIKLGMVDVIVTTAGGLEEDIMKAKGAHFDVATFEADDVELYEQGVNRVGNLQIKNEFYMQFEDALLPLIQGLYNEKPRWAVSDMLARIGGQLDDENSILCQASQHDVPVFCPAITDGALGFHLYLFQQKHKDFVIDVVKDFGNILTCTSMDEEKGVIALGGSVSKHHAILSTLLNGGASYAVYMTTAQKTSGSMSGATTQEAKSWGKVKDASDVATVVGDVTIMFPLAMIGALEQLKAEGLLQPLSSQESED